MVICFLPCWCFFFLAAYFPSENWFTYSLKIIFLRPGPEMQFWSNNFSCHFALFCLLRVGVCRWQWRGRIKVPWCCGCLCSLIVFCAWASGCGAAIPAAASRRPEKSWDELRTVEEVIKGENELRQEVRRCENVCNITQLLGAKIVSLVYSTFL